MIREWTMKSIKWMGGMLLGMVCSMQVHAHGGLSLAEDMCKLTVGPYTMHFTGYQPESTQEQEFCEDIPNVGRTIVALDYIDEALRPMTTEVRIIRDTGSEEKLDEITIFHMPPKVYMNGSVTFEHHFPAEGNFVGLVTVRDNDTEYVSRFPFAVGTGGKSNLPYILGALVLAAAAGFFFIKNNKTKNIEKTA
jgi:LPXTG-motif cell wall-anchored protein